MMLINNEEWSLVVVIKMTTDVILSRLGASAAKERDGKARTTREGYLPLFHVYDDGLGF